jgi:hypothetical protein
MKTVVRGQRKQLDQALGLAEAPLSLIDRLATHRDAETSEEMDP